VSDRDADRRRSHDARCTDPDSGTMVSDAAIDRGPVDCLVVGAGPAGLTAGIYLRRFHRRVVLADSARSRAGLIDQSHNTPGFPEGISGPDFLERLRQQFTDAGGAVTARPVDAITRAADGFRATVDGRTVFARTVLLATGTVDVTPDLPGIDELITRRLLRQCPICDAHEYSGRRILVLGDGAHARREALFIAHYSPQVCLVGTGGLDTLGESGDDGTMQALAQAGVRRLPTPAVAVRAHTGGDGLTVELRDGMTFDFDIAYAALGSRPRSELADSLGATLDSLGNVVVDAHCQTDVPGLYAAGDVVSALNQLAVAVGHAAIASTAIHNACRRAAAAS
jgi:thioredoxin reductase (NADPH)